MAIFTLEGRSDAESASLITDAYTLTDYSYHYLYDGLAWGYQHYGYTWGFPLTILNMFIGNAASQGILPGIPGNPDMETTQQIINQAGWYTLSADALGYQGRTNAVGTFYGEQQGYEAAQAEILGKYDDSGRLIQIGVAFRGYTGPRAEQLTDCLGDSLYLLKVAAGSETYVNSFAQAAFGTLLGKVAAFAAANGLNGADVIVTGSSQGGIAVNSMASLSEDYWDGFYSDAAYIPIASPVQYEGGKVLNVGYENDPVFRVLDGTDFTLGTLGVHDKPHESTTDNIVNFNDYYASSGWELMPFSLFTLAPLVTHAPFMYIDGFSRIMNSSFYSLTERDSTIIVANLSDAMRTKTWVEDANKYAWQHSGPTFILGSSADDLIAGGKGNDYIEGGAGDDIIRDAGGYNIILGGEGHDTLDLQHALNQTEIAWDDGTLYLRDAAGGITLASNIDTVRSKESFLFFWHKEKDYKVTSEGLHSGNTYSHYAASVTGDEADNTLTARVSGSWLFGHEGNDILTGTDKGRTTYVGGEGDDVLYSQGGENTFLFTGNFGHDILYNISDTDSLVFMGIAGATGGNYLDYLSFEEDNVIFDFGDSSVTLVGINPHIFEDGHVILA